MYIVSLLKSIIRIVYHSEKVLIISFIFKKVTIYNKYSDFVNIFSFNSIIEFLKYTSLNDYSIDLVDDK